MRLLLKLSANNPHKISLNYNYALSSAIYSLLNFGSPEFASFLHQIGYKSNNKTYKLFTFALKFESTKIYNNNLVLNSPNAFLYISSPIIVDFIKNFILGSFEKQCIELSANNITSRFDITQIESLPAPEFMKKNYFQMLSPMVLSTVEEKDEYKVQHFFRYDEDINEINRVLNQNLKNKYQIIHNTKYLGQNIFLDWDYNYLNNKLGAGKRLSKKISITKKGERPVEIIAIEIPFTLTGSQELIKVGYECGFGEKNSLGFGLAELFN